MNLNLLHFLLFLLISPGFLVSCEFLGQHTIAWVPWNPHVCGRVCCCNTWSRICWQSINNLHIPEESDGFRVQGSPKN
jgi:hypothetical protein